MSRYKASDAVDVNLYPDVARAGGLAALLIEIASGLSIDLGEVRAPTGVGQYEAATVATDRGRVNLGLAAECRKFSIYIDNETHVWAIGWTEQITEVVQVAGLWREGATLKQLRASFAFMDYTRMAQAYEDGNPVQVRWDSLLKDPELTDIRPFLLAAHSEPRLRRLLPSVSHTDMVRFSFDHADSTAEQILVLRSADDLYEVSATWDEDAWQALTSVEEAVRGVVALLP